VCEIEIEYRGVITGEYRGVIMGEYEEVGRY